MSYHSAPRRHGRQASVDIPKYAPGSQLQQPQPSLQPPLVSDYESDNAGNFSDFVAGSAPPPTTRTDAELNLSVLRRHNADIIAILSIAAYAVIYEFSPSPEPMWTKTGIEGTLFICQLSPGTLNEDRYRALVLNRRGLNNFEVELREADDGGIEISDPYVIVSYKEDGMQKIYGVFIFSEGPGTSTEQARIANAELMKTLATSAGYSRRAAEAATAHAMQQNAKENIQEAEAMAPSMGRQISLQQLFGKQRQDDADYSVIAHQSGDGVGQHHQSSYQAVQKSQTDNRSQEPNVLGDLFRRAGLT